SRIMTIPDLLAYRDTWKERLSDDFSLGRILFAARAAKSKPAAPEKLVMTSNGFKVKDRDAIAPSERGVRMVQSTLNKLTESNFDLIAKAILVPEIILNANVVADVVRLIYDKALVEPVFAGLYARLCYMIVRYEYDYRSTQSGEVDAQKSEVRVAIVEKCQQMFDGATKAVRETAS
ncbi:putative eukaryotic initiation factor 4a, partial [Trypanosoma cruzi]